MSPERLLARQQRWYDVARAVLWALIVAILVVALVTLGLVMNDIRDRQTQSLKNQATLQQLQEQNRDLLEAIRANDARRAQVVDRAITELSRREQAQLDEMERRILARQAELAKAIRELERRQTGTPAPQIVLVPVPTRPSPNPTPAPAPSPASCTP